MSSKIPNDIEEALSEFEKITNSIIDLGNSGDVLEEFDILMQNITTTILNLKLEIQDEIFERLYVIRTKARLEANEKVEKD